MIEFLSNIDENSLNTALWAIPAAAGALTLIAFGFIWWRKSRSVERVAEALGLGFAWCAPCDLKKTGLAIFNKGDDHTVTNQITGLGVPGAEARFFDYQFCVYGGRRPDKYMFTAALFEFQEPVFPAFKLRPEHIFDALAAGLGWEDIDIPGANEFSDKYHLSGKDAEAVRAFWTPARTAAFKLPRRCTAEANGRWLVFYRFAVSLDAKSYPGFIEEAKAAAASLSRP